MAGCVRISESGGPEAGFALNDGGISYLAESLRPLCNPALKQQQLRAQLTQLREQMAERIGRYYVSDNPRLELARRLDAARLIAARLIDCAGEQRFGELLRALQADNGDELEGIYYRIETRLPDAQQAVRAPTIGTAVDTDQMKALLGRLRRQRRPGPLRARMTRSAVCAQRRSPSGCAMCRIWPVMLRAVIITGCRRP